MTRPGARLLQASGAFSALPRLLQVGVGVAAGTTCDALVRTGRLSPPAARVLFCTLGGLLSAAFLVATLVLSEPWACGLSCMV